MTVVKKQRLGQAIVLPVPASTNSPFEEYEVYAGRDGAIVFLPKTPNPFTDEQFIQAHQNALTDDDFFPTS
ncbi:antitoxin of toxin-antitoxin stability system [Levilactobacillus yiduensis]|uniref:antitoxin of toxin-antitoxin stability system n=1 Tax=Levilactobacillus yiduensis TaxID=2953880 RepID=UPI000EF2C27C|nr:antitoxin of toxin-antitoxin stability system [Levilactobacillus yiduensis]AYM02324.1 antitoxin of toxin-antitoxin stability system [Levilactobacillus brevis]